MDNARKASEEGQQVEVTGKIVDNMACNIPKDKTDIGEAESADDRKCTRAYEICIIDHGIGMTKEQAERICDEFIWQTNPEPEKRAVPESECRLWQSF